VRYVTKHIIVDAIQWTGHNLGEIRDFAGPDFMEKDATTDNVWVRNAQGPYAMRTGYWVLRQSGHPLRVVSPAAFDATYEPGRLTP